MMTISLSEVSKRFNRDWIFRKFSYTFNTDHCYAITGPNGSGKSTLLQVIAGAIAMSEGEIRYELMSQNSEVNNFGMASGIEHQISGIPESRNRENGQKKIAPEDAFRYISIAAPYLELIEEMTAIEFLKFHQKFKPLLPGWEFEKIISIVGLEKAAKKQIRYYSSGMKQRIKLAQAIFSDTPVVLLDEPCTNLDVEGVELYQQLIGNFSKNRLVIVSSNDLQEYSFCDNSISILDYK
jgi:ABC-type multidrug transport system ATPase subunit